MCSIKQSSRAAPLLQLGGALHQPCPLHQLQKPSRKDWEDWEGPSSLLSPFATLCRSCQQRHQVTAVWKGDESRGRAGISVLCPPGARTSPPASPHPAFAAPGPAPGLCPGHRVRPSGRERAGLHIPKITSSITAAQGIPASTSTCPHTAGQPCIHLSVSPYCRACLHPPHPQRVPILQGIPASTPSSACSRTAGHPCIHPILSMSPYCHQTCHTGAGTSHRPSQVPPDPRPDAALGIPRGEGETISEFTDVPSKNLLLKHV